ncbi:MAG: TylF/MycF/NovP-related O-methyltransferase [Ferruginibacter sp.]
MNRKLNLALWKLFRTKRIWRNFPNNTICNDIQFWDLFMVMYEDNRAILSMREKYNIYRLVKQTAKIEGDIAEVGVYKGGSAKIIAEVKGNKRLHLFDTFEGMPSVEASIDLHKKGDFNDTSIESVKGYLAKYKDVFFYKGYFPSSTEGTDCPKLKYSFVNLDVDIYESTKSSLEFFYDRINKGGMILSHDYGAISCPGVKKAFDEFFIDKPETVIELWDSQCLVVKI